MRQLIQLVMGRRLRRVGVAFGLATLCACPLLRDDAPQPIPVIENATMAGTAACLECHEETLEAYAGTPHAHVMQTREHSCEVCHGAGSRHVDTLEIADILGNDVLRGLDPMQRSTLCLDCHRGQAGSFEASAHGDAGVSCWDCHADALHTRPPATELVPVVEYSWRAMSAHRDADPHVTVGEGPREMEFCVQCHGEVAADFALQYHHPVAEGTMRCTDCHDIHASARWGQLEGDDARCFECHQEVRGPFLFEHFALEEGCVVCHNPHGSVVEKLLVQADNGLCEQCHFDANFPLIGAVDHTGFLSAGARCFDCHFEVHGSNTNENFSPLGIEELLRGGRHP